MSLDVLIVDDDLDLRESMTMVLKDAGFTVKSARQGKEALDMLAAGPLPSVILLDLSMPVMSGPEFRRAQLSDPRLMHIPIVVVSASGRIEEEKPRMEIRDSLAKPFTPEALIDVVTRYCSRPK